MRRSRRGTAACARTNENKNAADAVRRPPLIAQETSRRAAAAYSTFYLCSFILQQTKRNAIIFGDIADRANANNSQMLTRNASLDESLLDNMKPSSSKPRKSVTFKDC